MISIRDGHLVCRHIDMKGSVSTVIETTIAYDRSFAGSGTVHQSGQGLFYLLTYHVTRRISDKYRMPIRPLGQLSSGAEEDLVGFTPRAADNVEWLRLLDGGHGRRNAFRLKRREGRWLQSADTGCVRVARIGEE